MGYQHNLREQNENVPLLGDVRSSSSSSSTGNGTTTNAAQQQKQQQYQRQKRVPRRAGIGSSGNTRAALRFVYISLGAAIILLGGFVANDILRLKMSSNPSGEAAPPPPDDLKKISHDARHILENITMGRGRGGNEGGKRKAPPSSHQKHCEMTIVLVRHSDDNGLNTEEKVDPKDRHCSYVGFERAKHVAELFDDGDEKKPTSKWPSPSYLFALVSEPAGGSAINYRNIETLLPLAESSDVPITLVRNPSDLADHIFNLFEQGSVFDAICGHVVVVSWKHEFLPEVAAYIGCGPKQGCWKRYPGKEYDEVWQIKYVYEPSAPVPLKDRLNGMEHLIIDESNILPPWDMMESHKHSAKEKQKWGIYGSKTYENFDSLRFSHQAGAYQKHGITSTSSSKNQKHNNKA